MLKYKVEVKKRKGLKTIEESLTEYNKRNYPTKQHFHRIYFPEKVCLTNGTIINVVMVKENNRTPGLLSSASLYSSLLLKNLSKR